MTILPATLAHSKKRRGGQEMTVIVSSARLYVSAHGCKQLVIALKYEGEEEYRHLVAKDMSWRTLDIVHAYMLRGLIEVFFEDWRINRGRTYAKAKRKLLEPENE